MKKSIVCRGAITVASLCVWVLLTACGGGSSAPRTGLLSTTPAGGSQAAEPNALVTARFAEKLQADTVNKETFLVDQGGAPVEGSVGYDAAMHEVRFSATLPLEFLTPYRATLTSAILTDGGVPIAPVQWNFRTRDGRWSDASPLPQATDDEEIWEYGDQAIGPDGSLWLIWQERHYVEATVWVARRPPGGDWGEPVQLFVSDQRYLDIIYASWELAPRLAFGPQGEAIAAWHEPTYLDYETKGPSFLWAARWDGTSWSQAEKIGAPEVGSSARPQVGIDAGGNSLVVWSQAVGDAVQLWSQRRLAASGWQPAQPLLPTRPPFWTLRMEPDGFAQVAWTDSTASTIGLVDYSPDTGWAGVSTLSTSSVPSSVIARRRPDGSSVVVWRQGEAGIRVTSQWFSTKDADGSWQAPVRLDGDTEEHDLALTPSGDVRLAYVKAVEGTNSEIWARRLVAGAAAWDMPQHLASHPGAVPASRDIRIVLDAKGRGLLAYEQFIATSNQHRVWTSRLADPAEGAWSEPVLGPDKDQSIIDLDVGARGSANLVLLGEALRFE